MSVNDRITTYMEKVAPGVDFRVDPPKGRYIFIYETFDGKVLEYSRVWTWRHGLAGWSPWATPETAPTGRHAQHVEQELELR